MAKKVQKKASQTPVEDYEMHKEYTRPTLPTGEYSGIATEDLLGRPTPKVNYSLEHQGAPDLTAEFAARDPDLDPQYIWRGKSPAGANALETAAPFIYQQEKIFPRMLIEEMKRQTAIRRDAAESQQTFAALSEDFDPNAKPSFYNHEEGWKNRMILGDSLQVMASLAENERLRGRVQMIYFDPPYGIKFNSNWQPSTKSTNVKDGKKEDITREPEMVKAFRDTWHDGIHSYLGYLRDRLVVARDLLSDTGCVFVQISEENVHKVRAILDEVFLEDNFISQISFRKKTMPLGAAYMEQMHDYILMYGKNKSTVKFRRLFREYLPEGEQDWKWGMDESGVFRELSLAERNNFSLIPKGMHVYRLKHPAPIGTNEDNRYPVVFEGSEYAPPAHGWGMSLLKMNRLIKAGRVQKKGNLVNYRLLLADSSFTKITTPWNDTCGPQGKTYVVQTSSDVIARCMLMCTDPGDLVLDPTCGSGTTAYAAEQWGRRWITIDTSRVALALARKRLMTAKYPYYLLADSEAGLKKEMELTGRVIQRSTFGKISQGFVYQRVPHVTLKAIANNSEIDTIWEKYEAESAEQVGIKAVSEISEAADLRRNEN